MKLKNLLGLLVLLVGLCAPMWAQQKAYTPAAGTPLRSTLMNALRDPVRVYYSKYFTGDTLPIFTVRHLKVSGKWAYAEVTTQSVTVEGDDEMLFNMSSVDANAGSGKPAQWTIDAWGLFEETAEGWYAVYNSTSDEAKDYEMSLDDGRIAAYKDIRKRYPKAPASIFP